MARIRTPMLSSCIVATNINFLCLVNLSPFVAQSMTTRRGIAALHTYDSAVYSNSMVLVVIFVCIIDTQSTEQLAISMTYLAQNLTQSGFALHSTTQPQANVASVLSR